MMGYWNDKCRILPWSEEALSGGYKK